MRKDPLFTPGTIGTMNLKNRIIMAPMGNINMADPIGRPLSKMIEYFAARARGGTGALITGLIPVSFGIDPTVSEDNDTTYFPRIDGSSRTRMAGWRDLVSAIHPYDCKIIIQLTAGLGRVGSPEAALKGKILKSASFNRNFYVPIVPHFPISGRGIGKIVKNFGQAAANARECGIDGVHLHGHEGYFMDQMTSLPWNRRRFGRYRDRFRFAYDIVREIKSRCGEDFPVMYRVDLTQGLRESYGDGIFKKKFRGLERTVEEGLEFCRVLAGAGVDAFDVDKGCYDNWFFPHPPSYFGDIPYVQDMAGTLREYFSSNGISVPVIAVGKLGKPDSAREVLSKGWADYVMLGRPLLADPDWPRKVSEGREKEIVHCIGDQDGCIQSFLLGGHPCCTVNPRAGFEDRPEPLAAVKPLNVAVVGAGPGGCEAAMILASRGYRVTVFEKGKDIGGQLFTGSRMKIKHDLALYMDNLSHRMKLASGKNLKIQFNKKADLKLLKNRYDAIICATGLVPSMPDIPGIENVPYTTAHELLDKGLKLPANVKKVTVAGGGVVGCELAYSLASERGLDVTIVEMKPDLMKGVVHANRAMLMWMLMGKGSPAKDMPLLEKPVQAYTASRITRIEKGRIVLEANRGRKDPYTPWHTLTPDNIHVPFAPRLKAGNVEEICVDTDYIVFATGGKPDNSLYRELCEAQAAARIFCIGDSSRPARAWEAIRDGYEVGRTL